MPHLETPFLSPPAPLRKGRGETEALWQSGRLSPEIEVRARWGGELLGWGGGWRNQKLWGTIDLTASLPLESGHMVLIRT